MGFIPFCALSEAKGMVIKMSKFTLPKPKPDFESLEKVLKGNKKPEKVYFVEFLIDLEIIKYFIENIWGEKWIPISKNTLQEYLRQLIRFHYRMGYDCIRMRGSEFWLNMPQFKDRKTSDTANLSRGNRTWVEEGNGIINDWEDFEKINWNSMRYDFEALNYTRKNLPQGMKLLVSTSLFETVLEKFLGYEGLFTLSHDNPELVSAVFEKWGQKVYDFYQEAIQYPEVGAIFHGDDLGSKTSTMMRTEFLRKHIFPWFKKFSSLAHTQGKMYWYHCCGNVLEVMDDLINDIEIDAFHSFQDVIIPVTEFKRKYPKIAVLGGIDMDKLSRMEKQELRKYVRDTLNECMPGKYALGSGNSIANYIPPENYLIMVEEGLNWNKQ